MVYRWSECVSVSAALIVASQCQRQGKKIAVALNVTTDWLIFKEDERALSNTLQLKFEAVSQMSDEDQRTIQSLIDGMILKHQTKKMVSNLDS